MAPPAFWPAFQAAAAATAPAAAAAAAFKLLLAPGYFSTDLEVHRNWLAVTSRLPPSEWYFDATSQWTLDYPPFFGWWQWALARMAAVAAPEALALSAAPVATRRVVAFQRGTVLATDALLWAALAAYFAAAAPAALAPGRHRAAAASLPGAAVLLVLLNFGLVAVDSLHFQYNGLLVAALLGVLAAAAARRPLAVAFLFTVLVHAKHIFLYAAPAVGVYLLVAHVGLGGGSGSGSAASRVPAATALRRLAELAAVAGGVTAASLAPVLLTSRTRSPGEVGAQLLTRLFPFARGLVHAYWAPNAWAVYLAADRVAAAACRAAVPARVFAWAHAPTPAGGDGVLGALPSHAAAALQRAVGRVAWAACVCARGSYPNLYGQRVAPGDAATGCAHTADAPPPPPNSGVPSVLPVVSPAVCAVLTAAAMAPVLWAMWRAGGTPPAKPAAVGSAAGREEATAAHAAPPSPQPGGSTAVRRRRARSTSAAPAGQQRRERSHSRRRGGGSSAVEAPAGTTADVPAAAVGESNSPSARLAQALPLCVAACSLAAFAFGYHVHEKAGLYVTLPLWAAVGRDLLLLQAATAAAAAGAAPPPPPPPPHAARLARLTWLLSVPLHFALLPLLFTPGEQPVAACGLACFTAASWALLRQAHGPAHFGCDFGLPPRRRDSDSGSGGDASPRGAARARVPRLLPLGVQVYLLAGLPALYAAQRLQPLLAPRLGFAPLLATSVYCAAGVGAGGVALGRLVAVVLR
jgi:hypothetical protein